MEFQKWCPVLLFKTSGIEAFSCHLLLRIAWMGMNKTNFFKFYCYAYKNHQKVVMVIAPSWSVFDIFVITLQEHFVYG